MAGDGGGRPVTVGDGGGWPGTPRVMSHDVKNPLGDV